MFNINRDESGFIGLGNSSAKIHVYIENRPPLEQYLHLRHIKALTKGEIHQIGEHTGNHWRKIFNVYAKLIFELSPLELIDKKFPTWQLFREDELLQENSEQCLLFSPYCQDKVTLRNVETINIIMGKTYAKKLGLSQQCHWLSEDFAINKDKKIIICPYFDYRQLSNIKIKQLAQLIKQLA
jgi:hypothetical protein